MLMACEGAHSDVVRCSDRHKEGQSEAITDAARRSEVDRESEITRARQLNNLGVEAGV